MLQILSNYPFKHFKCERSKYISEKTDYQKGCNSELNYMFSKIISFKYKDTNRLKGSYKERYTTFTLLKVKLEQLY